MRELIELPLGSAGEEYVARRLANGNALSRSVLRSSPAPAQSPVALVPAGTDPQRALRLDEGGLVRREPAIAELPPRLDRPMSVAGAVFVVEDRVARRGDPALARRRVPLAFFGDEVYWWTAAAAEIHDVLRAAASHHLNCFVTIADGLAESLSKENLSRLSRLTTVVALNAYDDESFVLWPLDG
jgi:hypothetical protein